MQPKFVAIECKDGEPIKVSRPYREWDEALAEVFWWCDPTDDEKEDIREVMEHNGRYTDGGYEYHILEQPDA